VAAAAAGGARKAAKPGKAAAAGRSGGGVCPDILVGTPSRVLEALDAGAVPALDASCHACVIDEADLVLSYGFEDDVRKLVARLPRIVQCCLVSATLSQRLDALKRLVLHSPAVLRLEEGQAAGGGALTQFYLRVGEVDRYLLLYAMLKLRLLAGKSLFFAETADVCFRLKLFLERFGIRAAVLNPELPFNSRLHTLQAFNRGTFDYLIATDASLDGGLDVEADDEEAEEAEEAPEAERAGSKRARAAADGAAASSKKRRTEGDSSESEEEEEGDAFVHEDSSEAGSEAESEAAAAPAAAKSKAGKAAAAPSSSSRDYGVSRGVDFRAVSTVVNFDFPATASAYIHRIGRTARGGASGVAVSFLDFEGVNATHDAVLEAVSADAVAAGTAPPQPLPLDLREVEGFRYRVEDVLRGVTPQQVKQARQAELKAELLASQALQAHFEDNPRDLAILQHDRVLTRRKEQLKPHLRTVPAYLLPPTLKAAVEAAGAGLGSGPALAGGAQKNKKKKNKGNKRAGAPGKAGGGGANKPGGRPAPAAARVTSAQAVALAEHEVYHARRHNADPLKTFAYARS
jgi:ATP-dependent RNA helicase DDX56/DBP9